MTASKVDVSNMALNHCGVDVSIESMTELSKAARVCNRWYDHARKEALEAFNWGFARKRLVVAEHGEDPPDTWAYRYQYPADCLVVRELQNPVSRTSDPVPYEIEIAPDSTKSILCDLEDPIIVYTYDLEDLGMFSTHFISTLAYLLAHYIVFTMTAKRTMRADLGAMYNAYLKRAPAMNANEKQEDQPVDADWITGRQ